MRCFQRAVLFTVCLGATPGYSAESPPEIGYGATRQEVIDVLGPPIGRSRLGAVEILHYRQGQVRLENGRVERVSLKATAPRPAPATSAPSAKGAITPAGKETRNPEGRNAFTEVWMTNFEDALRDAARRDSVVVALFTSSDATPASRQFQREVAWHPEFVNAFRGQYVLLHVDYPVRTELAEELRAQNEALRNSYGVEHFPAMLVLSPTGERLGAVEISDAAPSSAYRGRLISAVMAAYNLPTAPVATAAPREVPIEPVAPAAPAQVHVAPAEITNGLESARWLILAALGAGTLIAGIMLFALWLVIRKMNKPVALNRRSSMASRIDHAASGLPTHAEILTWSRDAVCRVTARLAETDGFEVEVQPRGSDRDLVLKRPGNVTPDAIACCVTGSNGVTSARRLKDLAEILAEENIPEGWFISPMGFSLDARAFADQNNIRLIDSGTLLVQLGDLPTFALPTVLAHA